MISTRASGGAEVVQLYSPHGHGRDAATQQLIGFVRVDLEPGATETITFEVPMSVIAYTGSPANSSSSRVQTPDSTEPDRIITVATRA